MESVDVSVKWPFKWCLVGSSGSGKTIFSLNLIKNIHRLVDMAPSKIVIIFKEYQDIYDEFKKYFPTELIHEEEADIEYITKDNKERMLLICDDLYFYCTRAVPEAPARWLRYYHVIKSYCWQIKSSRVATSAAYYYLELTWARTCLTRNRLGNADLGAITGVNCADLASPAWLCQDRKVSLHSTWYCLN